MNTHTHTHTHTGVHSACHKRAYSPVLFRVLARTPPATIHSTGRHSRHERNQGLALRVCVCVLYGCVCALCTACVCVEVRRLVVMVLIQTKHRAHCVCLFVSSECCQRGDGGCGLARRLARLAIPAGLQDVLHSPLAVLVKYREPVAYLGILLAYFSDVILRRGLRRGRDCR